VAEEEGAGGGESGGVCPGPGVGHAPGGSGRARPWAPLLVLHPSEPHLLPAPLPSIAVLQAMSLGSLPLRRLLLRLQAPQQRLLRLYLQLLAWLPQASSPGCAGCLQMSRMSQRHARSSR